MMYWFLVAFFVLSALVVLFDLRRSFSLFLIGYLVLPFASTLSSSVYRQGLYAFDYYFIIAGPILVSMLSSRIEVPSKPYVAALGLLLGGVSISAGVGLLNGLNMDEPFLRDLRIPLVAVEGFLLSLLIWRSKPFDFDFISRVALIGSTAAVVSWGLNYAGVFGVQDVYYVGENRHRLWTTGSMFGTIYLTLWFVARPVGRPLYLGALLISTVAAVVSGQRWPLAVAAIVALLWAPKGRRVPTALFFAAGAAMFVGSQIFFGVDRVETGLSLDGMMAQLGSRFSPAQRYFAEMDWEVIAGFGFGTSFEIPWFAYRGLDTSAAGLDSTHITYFVKFGLLYVVFLYVLLSPMTSGLNPRLKWAMATLFLLNGLLFDLPGTPMMLAYQIAGSLLACAAVGTQPDQSVEVRTAQRRQGKSMGQVVPVATI